MKAMILAAGKGTRVQPLTYDLPKPMIPILGKPVMAYLVEHLAQHGVTDIMVIASGTSSRHVKSLADNVLEKVKQQGVRPLGSEGLEGGEWALLDLGDVVVHVMLPTTREFYDLERLWRGAEQSRAAQGE